MDFLCLLPNSNVRLQGLPYKIIRCQSLLPQCRYQFLRTREDSEVPYANFERIIHHAPSHVETFVREGDIHSITVSFTEPEKDAEYSARILDFLESNFSKRK